MPDTRTVVRAYYDAWGARDKQAAAALLAPDLRVVSVWGVWESAAEYLEEFDRLAEGIAAIEYLREIYDAGEAFVLFRVVMESGAAFIGTDLLTVADDKIQEVVNVNSGDPTKLVDLVG